MEIILIILILCYLYFLRHYHRNTNIHNEWKKVRFYCNFIVQKMFKNFRKKCIVITNSYVKHKPFKFNIKAFKTAYLKRAHKNAQTLWEVCMKLQAATVHSPRLTVHTHGGDLRGTIWCLCHAVPSLAMIYRKSHVWPLPHGKSNLCQLQHVWTIANHTCHD